MLLALIALTGNKINAFLMKRNCISAMCLCNPGLSVNETPLVSVYLHIFFIAQAGLILCIASIIKTRISTGYTIKRLADGNYLQCCIPAVY